METHMLVLDNAVEREHTTASMPKKSQFDKPAVGKNKRNPSLTNMKAFMGVYVELEVA